MLASRLLRVQIQIQSAVPQHYLCYGRKCSIKHPEHARDLDDCLQCADPLCAAHNTQIACSDVKYGLVRQSASTPRAVPLLAHLVGCTAGEYIQEAQSLTCARDSFCVHVCKPGITRGICNR